MRPNTDTQFRQAGTMSPTQSVRMSVDQENIQHIMSVLTDLYSDPVMAVIREYSTNAHDSHVASGVSKPIEVSLPGAFDRSFRVQDFGTGLSVDDLINICSKYGHSTKRDNDNESGMLGLGFKAGLTYTDQFSVTAVKDGVKTIAVVKRDEDGAGVIDIIDTVTTDEDNGVLVKVAVNDSITFNNRAKEFFRFWASGTVLVDGQEPTPVEGLQVTDDIVVVPNANLSSDYVVMGNIGYNVGRRLSDHLPYGYCVVARVKMGDVNFTPNREALHYTPRTEATLRNIQTKAQEGIQESAQAEVDKSSTHYDAMVAAQHWARLARGRWFTYKGESIPDHFDMEGWSYNLNAYRYAMNSERRVDISTITNALQVTGYENENVSTTVRRKVKEYLADKNISVKYVLFTKDRIGDKWTEGLPSVDYSIIKAIKLNSGPRGTGRVAGEPIRCYVDGSHERHPIDQIPGKHKVVYSSAQDLTGRDLGQVFPDATIVELSKNRWEKFMRENKGAESVDDALVKALKEIQDSMTLTERINMSGARHRMESLSGLDANRVEDPMLVDLIRAYNGEQDKERVLRFRQVMNMMRGLNIIPERIEDEWTETLDKYPLLQYAGRSDVDREHLYDYVNHFYKESN